MVAQALGINLPEAKSAPEDLEVVATRPKAEAGVEVMIKVWR